MSAGNQEAPYQRPDPLAVFPLVARHPLQGLPSKIIFNDSTYEFYGPLTKLSWLCRLANLFCPDRMQQAAKLFLLN
jgi:hypothetical protein